MFPTGLASNNLSVFTNPSVFFISTERTGSAGFHRTEYTVIEKNPARRKRTHSTAVTEPTEIGMAAATERIVDDPHLAGIASVIRLEQGLYALEIAGTTGLPGQISGAALPLIQVSSPPGGQTSNVEIIGASSDASSWVGHDGGTVVVKSPPGGGNVWVTAFGRPEDALVPPQVEPRSLDRRRPNGAAPGPLAVIAEPAEIRTEIVLHVERLGDRRFAGQGWIGGRGRKLRIEAFSIRPIETLTASDIEIKGLGPHGRETPWVSGGKLCGTRGQRLPLTGFAVRRATHASHRFDVLYEGAFFESGIAGPFRNGELCIPPLADDPLEAINVRVIRRAGQ